MVTQPNTARNVKIIKTEARELTVREYLAALNAVAAAYAQHPATPTDAQCIATATQLRAVLDGIGVADAWAWNELVWTNSPALYEQVEMNQTFLECWLELVVAA